MVGVGESFPQADALYTVESEQEIKSPGINASGGDDYNLAALDREGFSIPKHAWMIWINS